MSIRARRVLPIVMVIASHIRSVLLLALAMVATASWASPSATGILFADVFDYPTGDLAGNNGGVGWAGAWSGGTSQVADPLAGTVGKSVRLASDSSVTSRALSAAIGTGSTPYFVSFIFNASPFQASPSGDVLAVAAGSDHATRGGQGRVARSMARPFMRRPLEVVHRERHVAGERLRHAARLRGDRGPRAVCRARRRCG